MACLLLAMALAPNVKPLSCDMIELNYFYSDTSQGLVFAQYIFWDFDPYRGVFVVRDWRLLKDSVPPAREKGIYTLTITDHKTQILNVIKSEVFIVTHTTFDPELLNREVLPSEKRVHLLLKGVKP